MAVPASAAVYTYDLSDNSRGALTSLGYSYGLRLDSFDAVQDSSGYFNLSFEGATASKTQLKYDDVNGIVEIDGEMTRSYVTGLGTATTDIWDVYYRMTGVTNVEGSGSGLFIDYAGNGTGSITNGVNSYALGAKARGTEFFLLTSTSKRNPATGDIVGEGWVNQPGTGDFNDFLFVAEIDTVDDGGSLPGVVPVPGSAILLLTALAGAGAVARRKTRA